MKRISILGLLLFSVFSLSAQDDEPAGKLQEANRAMNQRNYREAELIYRELLSQNPEDMTLKQFLCHALMNQKKYNDADSMLRRMVEKDSNNIGNYWYLGLSQEKQRKDSMAIYWFKYYIQKSKDFTSNNVKVWLYVGGSYRRLMHDTGITATQYEDMVYHYQKYLKLNPGDPYMAQIQDFLEAVNTRKPKGNERLKWDEKS
ncbi:MAG: tetratricopeptide repeat protein [Bacteroidetes bacterium]|nr:tetratricopeptide repeat protein [Bacteroidota bacterium]